MWVLNFLSKKNFILLVSIVSVAQLVERLTGVLKDLDLIPSSEDFFSLKFLLKRKLDKWKRATRAATTTTTQVITRSLANYRRQKEAADCFDRF